MAKLCAVGALLLSPQAVEAGPVFEIIGGGSSAPFALSNNWGITSTGAGGMVGTMTFRDGFVLPTPSSSVINFSENDIVALTYSHIVTPFSAGSTIIPEFSFAAAQADISSAFGQVVLSGSEIIISSFNLSIETTVQASEFANFGSGFAGIFQGNYFISGISAGIHDTESTLASPLTADVTLVPLSTAPGSWRLTGFSTATAVPEPSALAMFALGLAGLVVFRRRKRARSQAWR